MEHKRSPSPDIPQTPEAALARVQSYVQADAFVRQMGMELVDAGLGYAVLRMTPGAAHMNFYGMLHGGVTFALADAAFGFACNSYGERSPAIGNYITFFRPGTAGEPLTATARRISASRKLATYHVEVTNAAGEMVATLSGTCFLTGRPVELPT
ncbi:MAG: hotdog fold thioesterase [Candidatus Lambdaproteobacteria bacterium]|nr:hotdog fold thioesterase [Candidatus Lambdaproteobacteria bacterium]